MAQVFGTSGRNAADESHKRTKRLLAYGFFGIATLALLGGYAIGAVLPIRGFGFPRVLVFDSVLLVVIVLIAKWATEKIDATDRDRMLWRKGAVGEALVAQILSELPADFVV